MQSLNPTLVTPPATDYSFANAKAAVYNRLRSPFFIRLLSWEYWPFAVVYVPVFVYWLWLSLKARSFFFFSAANPSIESGGLLGESKIDILDKIGDEFKPKTLFISASTHLKGLFERIEEAGLTFPMIAKPNAGERGWRVEKLDHWESLVN